MTSPDPELMQLFDFSVSDLNANREGKLSTYQVKLLRQNVNDVWFALGCLPVGVVILFLCLIPFMVRDPRNADPLAPPIILGGGVFLVLFIIGIGLYSIRQRRAELENPMIHSEQGSLHVYMKSYGNNRRFHALNVGNVELAIKPSQYEGLKKHITQDSENKTYTVFYTDYTKTVLSIEALS
jgi:hypothetical protein